MKKLFLAAALLLALTAVQAQIRFGIKGGVNFSDLNGDIATSTRTGFHVGAIVEIKASPTFSIQPELVYSAQGAKITSSALREINYNYITVPVLLKYYVITDALSIEAGPQFAFLVNDNVGQTFKTKSFDFGAVGGVGLNITKSFFTQAHYVMGLSNTTSDAKITNRVIQLSLGYEF